MPPSWPEMSTTSALALLTPAATVPTPTSATSFTLTRARVGVLEVVDELLEVLDGVDVVVGGGEISPTPGVECRVLAIHGYTLWPGSWPPSPGLAPCAILICRSSALTRYSLVTPKRPDATCLMAERRESPLGSGT